MKQQNGLSDEWEKEKHQENNDKELLKEVTEIQNKLKKENELPKRGEDILEKIKELTLELHTNHNLNNGERRIIEGKIEKLTEQILYD